MKVRVVLLLCLCLAAACSSGPKGLGKGACPYIRPRLVRLDAALVSSGPAATANVDAVAADVAIYVKTSLPANATAKSDQPLVRFSQALSAYAATPGGSQATLDTTETALKTECAVGNF